MAPGLNLTQLPQGSAENLRMIWWGAQAVTALLEAGNLSGSTEVSVPKWQHSQATGTMLPLHEALRACYDIRYGCGYEA